MIDTWWHDLDAPGSRSVEALELRGFLGAAREDRVGAADDLDLGAHAALGLLVARFGLDASEGVKGRDEREPELVLQAVSREARQPVVRMDDVSAPAGFDVVADLVGEGVDGLGKRFLRKVRGPDVDVAHPKSGFDRDLGRQALTPSADVDSAVDSRLGQGRHELAHVDVHPARVGNARLGEWRRVQ